MPADAFTTALGMTLPVVQAPVGGASTPALAAAVSTAGGLGTLAMTWTPVSACTRRVRRTQQLTDRPFGVNLVLAWAQHERLAACLDEGVRVVSTSWGDPAPYVQQVHDAGALHVHAVASADEARRAAAAGVDALVAQGWEAGGHVLGTVSTMALVPAVVDAVDVPVLAAGGIADARGVRAVLALGAVAAWVGTRFLLADEADVHPRYRERLQQATETDTVHTGLFDGGWPDAPHRVLRNATVARWETAGREDGDVVAHRRDGSEVLRYDSDLPTSTTTGDVEAMALYAGQGVALARTTAPAADIARELAGLTWSCAATTAR